MAALYRCMVKTNICHQVFTLINQGYGFAAVTTYLHDLYCGKVITEQEQSMALDTLFDTLSMA